MASYHMLVGLQWLMAENCSCERPLDGLAMAEWSDESCPFAPNRHFYLSSQNPYQILEGLSCGCGKQMGQRIFSSDRLIGYWRLHSHLVICREIARINKQFQQIMTTKMEEAVQIMDFLQKRDTRIIEKPLQSGRKAHGESGKKSKKRSNSKKKGE